MKQHHRQGLFSKVSKDQPSFAENHLWRLRWVTLMAFILILVGSLTVIVITNNSLLVSLPGSMLLAMRPIIRFIFTHKGTRQEIIDSTNRKCCTEVCCTDSLKRL